MQIFFFDENPRGCANKLNFQQVKDGIKQVNQLLANVLNYYGQHTSCKKIPKANNQVDGVAFNWIKENRSNFEWACGYLESLLFNYFFLNNYRGHSCWANPEEFKIFISQLPEGELTKFPSLVGNKIKQQKTSAEVCEAFKKQFLVAEMSGV